MQEFKIGDRTVKLKTVTMDGVFHVLEQLERAKLPMPVINGDKLGVIFSDAASYMGRLSTSESPSAEQVYAAQMAANMKFQAAMVALIADNSTVIWQWLLRSRQFVSALICAGTDLKPEDVGNLTPATFIRLSQAVVGKLSEDGVWSAVADFFGGLTGTPAGNVEEQPTIASPATETVAA